MNALKNPWIGKRARVNGKIGVVESWNVDRLTKAQTYVVRVGAHKFTVKARDLEVLSSSAL
jgi:hypothetical protein